jgi:hypothetical protein
MRRTMAGIVACMLERSGILRIPYGHPRLMSIAGVVAIVHCCLSLVEASRRQLSLTALLWSERPCPNVRQRPETLDRFGQHIGITCMELGRTCVVPDDV